MIKRIITGLIALAILIPLLVFSGTFVFPVLLAIVTVICLFEMFRCMGIHKKYDITMSAYTVAVIVPFFMRYIDNKVSVAKLCFVVGIMYLITVFASMIWSHGRIQFNDSMTIFVITAYIIGSINSIIFVRDFEDVGQYVYMLIFFVLGFLIYAFMFGAVGSTASRLEDINTSVMPITILFIAGFFIVVTSMSSGDVDGTFIKICSYVPFFSPMAMFTRIAMSTVPDYEIAISIAILVASTVGIGALSAKIYRVGVLLYGTPPKMSAIIKAIRKA